MSFHRLLVPAIPALFASIPTSALVTVKDLGGNVVNGQVLSIYAASTTFLMEQDLICTLDGPVSRTINVKRYEVGPIVPVSENYFCWGVCYLPQAAGAMPYWDSVDEVDMTPGVDFSGFHAYYRPNGSVGFSTFRFVWYDMDNPTDTTWVDIVFDTQHVGLEEVSASVNVFEAFPNPCTNGTLTLQYALDHLAAGTEMVLYNALGDRTRSFRLSSAEGRIVIGSDELVPGVYFASLEHRGEHLATQRVAVGSR